MKYRCDNPKCKGKGWIEFLGVYNEDFAEKPLFTEVRRATYEMNEDGDTVGLLDWDDEPLEPIKCAYCDKPAKAIKE